MFSILCFAYLRGRLTTYYPRQVSKEYLIKLFKYFKLLLVALVYLRNHFFSPAWSVMQKACLSSGSGVVALLKGFYDTAPFDLLLLKNASLALIFLFIVLLHI